MKKTFILPLLCAMIGNAYAQPAKPVAKSPEASALVKAIEYPTNNSTGVPNISIPLFGVSSGELNYDVQLSYHAGGIKVGQLPSWVGVNWSINAAPQITRTVNGRSDLDLQGYLYNNAFGAFESGHQIPGVNFIDKQQYLNALNKGLRDEQPDEFSYSLMNKSGKFMYQKYEDHSFKAIPIPYDQLDIQYNPTTFTFTIIDADGVKYEFGGDGYIERSWMSGEIENVTSWKCSRIVSANLKDTITFDYHPVQTKFRAAFSAQVELYDNSPASVIPMQQDVPLDPNSAAVGTYRPNPVGMKVYGGIPNPFINTYFVFAPDGDKVYDFNSPNIYFDTDQYQPEPWGNTSITEISSLKQINYKGNKIEFFVKHLSDEVLDSIRVTNYLGQYIKTIKFGSGGSELTGVKFTSGQQSNDVYKFDYNPGNNYYSEDNTPADAWGYPNPSNGPPGDVLDIFNTGPFPYQWVSSYSPAIDIHYTNQNYSFPIGNNSIASNEDDMKVGVLRRITYPGGGYTDFDFEANRYLRYSTDTILAGGLRVKSIKNYATSGTGPASEKYFKYGYTEDGIGEITTDPDVINFEYDQTGNFQYPNPYGTSNIQADIPNFRKRTFVKASMDINAFSNGASVNYPFVTIYESQDGHQTGKTTYAYRVNHSNFRYVNTPLTQHQTDIDNGQLISETQYAYTGGQFEWIKRKIFTYENHLFQEKVHVGKVYNTYVLMGDVKPDVYGDADIMYGNFMYISYGLNMGYSRLIAETDSMRFVGNLSNVLGTSKEYYYDNVNHIYPTRVVTSNSKGEIFAEYTSYPQDYSADGGMISSLLLNHKLSYPVEKVLAKRGGADQIVSGSLNLYEAGSSNYHKALSLETPNAISIANFKFSDVGLGLWPESNTRQAINQDTRYSEKASFDVYNSFGKISQITTNLRQVTTYLWSYRGTCPTIEIKNLDYAALVTYFGITMISNFENSSPNKAAVDNFVSLIKAQFPQSIVTSSVYTPLIGVISSTDPKGVTTYYEYDNFQRLINVRDKDGKILKHTDYHYAGQ